MFGRARMVDFKIRVIRQAGVLQALADIFFASDQDRLAEIFLLEPISGANDRFFFAFGKDDAF